jgi:hypothetical protein
MTSFLSDVAEEMAGSPPSELAPAMSALRIASDWTWFEADLAGGDSAPAAAFRVVEAIGRALVTAGAGMAAPASATVTVLSMIYVSRRRIGGSVLPSHDVEGLDVNEPMYVLR